MSYRTRLSLLVTGLLLFAVIAVSGLLAWNTHRAMLAEAHQSGELVAKVLARAAALATEIPREMEKVVGEAMVSKARLTAHLVAEAERAGRTPEEIVGILGDVAERSDIAEFWITDARGRAYLHTVPGVDFTFDPDPAKQPQAHAFWPLIAGTADRVVQEARRREIDDRIFKYAGVGGVDGPRIVQLGVDVGFLDAIAERVGLHQMVRSLLGGGDINAIWVIGSDLKTLAHASIYGIGVPAAPDDDERALLARVLASGKTESDLAVDHLAVVSPVVDAGKTIGAAVVRLPTDRLRMLLAVQTQATLAIVLVVLLLGGAISVAAARRVTVPVTRLTEAALAMENRAFDPGDLAETARRPDEIGRLADVFGRMAQEVLAREEQLDALVKERTRQLEARTEQLVAAHKRIDEELRVAQALQIAMLPTEFLRHPAYEMFGIMSPAREVGGDFYDYLALDDRRVLIAIGDVSGKGVPPAFFMVLTRTLIQNLATPEGSPADLLRFVNGRLCTSNPQNLFVTVFCAVLDTETGELRYANAGHNPPFRLSAEGEPAVLPSTGDMALGVLEDQDYTEARAVLEPGELLFLYTDGLTEAFSPAGELFGEGRLARAVARGRDLSMQALVVEVIEAVEGFAAGLEQADDATCLALRYKAGIDGLSA
jgi:sigma-B regulation protein RsbU (phosphoserine phosphatase)